MPAEARTTVPTNLGCFAPREAPEPAFTSLRPYTPSRFRRNATVSFCAK